MSNYSIKIDCLKLKGAFLRNLRGASGTAKRCLIILVDDCDGMYVGEKGCYLNLTALEMQNPKYGDTHCIKANLTKEQRETMTEEAARNTPILGGMHALERRQLQPEMVGDNDSGSGEDTFDDLPF